MDRRNSETRGRVLPFIRPDMQRGGRSAHRVRAAKVSAVDTSIGEEALNAEWNRLLELTAQACTWRDPESIAAVKATLGRLERQTLRDWFR